MKVCTTNNLPSASKSYTLIASLTVIAVRTALGTVGVAVVATAAMAGFAWCIGAACVFGIDAVSPGAAVAGSKATFAKC